MLYRLLIFALLMATWLVFSGLFDAFHTTLGILSAAFVTWISSDLLFADRKTTLSRRIRQAGRMVHYLLWLLWQVVLSNIDILRLALSPSRMKEVQPRIVKFHTGLKSDFEKFMLANSITLTPGTITVKILGDAFYVHAISKHAADGLDGEMERRIAAIFAEPEPKGAEN
ncbi:MAG: Na+/H+ antiporter subunit E [Verrucomicrobiae bacterium]|nr:Na+/H+ antiporter subunit E [Verrucomicrobiae bacterium]